MGSTQRFRCVSPVICKGRWPSKAIWIRSALGAGPFVFNLGHGILPQTPPEHVALLTELLSQPVDRS